MKVIKLNKWFYFNATLFIFALYKVIYGSHLLVSLIGGLGLLFILFNWTRHAMFSTIRSNIPRQTKIKYAKLSKRVLPIHKWTGMTAFIIIIYHGYLAINLYGFNLGITKIFSGMFGIIVLTGIVIFGWLRWFKASYIKRIIHLWLGLLLFFVIIVHVIL